MGKDDTIAALKARIARLEKGDVAESSEACGTKGGVSGSPPAVRPRILDGAARRASLPRDEETACQSAQRDDALQDEEKRAFQKIIRLASAREQCAADLRARLLREGFSEQCADSAIGRAVRIGAVDDGRYADAYVRARIAAGRGSAGIASDLRDRNIDPDDFSELRMLLDDSADELDRALKVLERKPPRSKNLREGAYRKLVQRGYSSSVASRAARLWFESCV